MRIQNNRSGEQSVSHLEDKCLHLTSLVVAVVHCAEDVLCPAHRPVAPAHGALRAARPVAVGAVLAHPLLLASLLLATILGGFHLRIGNSYHILKYIMMSES